MNKYFLIRIVDLKIAASSDDARRRDLTSDVQVILRGCGASCWSWYTTAENRLQMVCQTSTEKASLCGYLKVIKI